MQILTDALHRIAYATDASAYREMPVGVAYPKTEDDIRELLVEAKRRGTCLIPRAAGTSIAGQVVGSGIVMDVSRYMNQILEIHTGDRLQVTGDRAWVRVQPGVVRDELNMALKPYGLFFSPETSTSNRCCIGGMVGNNSCGTHSLIYGSTRHHVIGLRAMLADGSILVVESRKSKVESLLGETIISQLQGWQKDEHIRQLLKDNFPDPSIRRRSCGYALDEALLGDRLQVAGDIDLCKLICGSEGTLCIVTEITLSLDPLPPAHKMVVCQMLDKMDDAWEANLQALKNKPVAVELIDGKILELAKNNISAQKNMAVLNLDPDHLPKAILVSEYWSDSLEALQSFSPLTCSAKSASCSAASSKLYDEDVQKVWDLRKAGLGVLTSMEGDAKPVGVIEDTAVAPERLGAYMHDFEAMMQGLGLECVYYGHISTGELHLRPILNLKLEKDRKLFREVATETAKLVKKHHGSLSGEHGDGRLRGEFIPLMYGEEIYNLFCQLKATWDPENLLNMGKIVNTPPMDAFFRVESNLQIDKFTNLQIDLLSRIERCNGAGDCRKSNLIGGTMCPAYKVSGEEIATTRARANVLREKLTHDPKGVTSEEIKNVLDSCLACKGCKSECPSNVDMTRIRSEILQLCYNSTHTPFRSWMVARMTAVERLGSIVPDIYNWFATNRLTSTLIKKIVRFSTKRNIPTLSRHSMRWLVKHSAECRMHNAQCKGKVYLFADEFTNYQEAELGLKFAQLVRALGYEVEVPKHVESGRAAISKGCLKLAAKFARKNVELLSPIITDETPLVGIEPSCILSFRDEYPYLVDNAQCTMHSDAVKLAKNCLLYDEWLMREVEKGNISSVDFNHQSSIINHQSKIYLHGHCHQKALVGVEKTADCLRLTGAEVHIIPSGCCGLAGSFGYEKEHYETSMKIGEMVLFPTIRQIHQSPITNHQSPIIAAPGTSCRQQILDGTGIKAYHPIEILYNAIYGNISACAEYAPIANS